MRRTDDGSLFGDSRNRGTRHSNPAIDSRAIHLISRFRRSPMELQRLSRELEDLTEVMVQIQRWKRTYSSSSPSNNASEAFSVIQVGLQTLLEDIGKIKDAIEKCVARDDTVFGRVRTRVRSFLSGGEIFEMAARLMHHKTTLHFAVSVISG